MSWTVAVAGCPLTIGLSVMTTLLMGMIPLASPCEAMKLPGLCRVAVAVAGVVKPPPGR